MPEPPARVRATKPTRQSTVSMPLYSAKPPLTPPSILSVPLRRSGGRAGEPGSGGGCSQVGGSTDGGTGGGADVMGEACRARALRTIGEHPEPSLKYAPDPGARADASRTDATAPSWGPGVRSG